MPTRLWLLLLSVAGLSAQSANLNIISTFAGTDPSLANVSDALSVPLPYGPWGKPAVDAAGNIYFSLTNQNVVLRLTPAGRLERFAGNGFARFSGDGGPATQASLNGPRDIAIDSRGVVYIADVGNKRIRRVLPSRIIDTFAGGGRLTPTASGVTSTDANLPAPASIAADGTDNIYFTIDANSIARVDYGANQLRLFAGTPGTAGIPESGPAASARFRIISALATDKPGNLYLTDAGAISVSRISSAGRLEVLTTRSATFGAPADVTVDSAGVIYFTQIGSAVVWRLQANNTVDIYSGDVAREGFTPSGTPLTRALYGDELRVAVDARNNVIVGDRKNSRLRRISSVVDTIAGADFSFDGDAGPARSAVFFSPNYIAQAPNGTYYFTDSTSRLVFSIDPKGTFRRFAGNGILNAAFTDGRAALEGAFGTPTGIAVDSTGAVYIADDDCAIRRIGSDNAMRLYAGVPNLCGSSRDGTAIKDVRFGRLRGLTIDSAGNFFVTDITNHKVWRIGADGVLRTFAGTGSAGTSTTSLPAVQAALNNPIAVAVATDGTVFISDQNNNRIVRVGTEGRLTTYAGVGQRASTGDNGPATAAAINQPAGLALDRAGNLFLAEFAGNRVRRIDPSGTITTYAGTGIAGARGDGGFAISAQLNSPAGLLLNAEGQLFIADRDNGRIRLVLNAPPAVRFSTAPVTVSLSAGEFTERGTIELPSALPGLGYEASVRYPSGPSGWLTIRPERGTLPSVLGYEVNTAGLAGGTYSAQLVITVPAATPRETIIPVNITVPAPPQRVFLTRGNSRLTISALKGDSARQTVPILNPGATPLTVKGTVVRGAFLTVTPAELTIPPGQAASFTVTADAGTLASGTYTGLTSYSAGGLTYAVEVAFNVSAARSRIILSQSGLSFRAVSGGSVPPAQILYALPADKLSVQTQTVSGTPWLSAALEGNQITVSVAPQELATGDHYGRITVFDPASPTVRRFATVLLQVLPAGTDPGPEVSPAALLYTATVGGEVPGQDVQIYLPTNRKASFTATGATFEGQPWLQFAPAGGSVSGAAPARVTVQPDLSGLAGGIYRGAVTLLLDNGQTRTVSILAVVSPATGAGAKSESREASGCANDGLFPQVLAPAANFVVTVGQPMRLSARVVDGCGNLHQPESGGSAGVAVTGLGTQVINLTHVGAGVWEGTGTPSVVQESSTLTFLGLFTRGTSFQAGAEKVNGSVFSASRPVVFSDSLTDAASFQFGAPVAPGTLVSLFGSNLSPANAVPSTLPLPVKLEDVEVRLNDQPIPLLFAGANQVNAQIPYALDADTEYQLEIRRGTAIATPQPVVISQARPGVFTVDQSGQGQAHVYRALPDGSQILAGAATPTTAGEVVIIYCNGLGMTNPVVTAGAAAPLSPLAVTANPVTVTIGDKAAPVAFAGLAPGFTGLYQINATVPAGITPGGAVPLVLTVAGQSSVPVTVGVR